MSAAVTSNGSGDTSLWVDVCLVLVYCSSHEAAGTGEQGGLWWLLKQDQKGHCPKRSFACRLLRLLPATAKQLMSPVCKRVPSRWTLPALAPSSLKVPSTGSSGLLYEVSISVRRPRLGCPVSLLAR